MNNMLKRLPAWIRNKYFISIAVFCVVILFLDKNDLFSQMERTRELKKLEQSRAYYSEKIAAERKELEGLKNDPGVMEKYAREKYLMKRDDQDLFLVPENPDTPKK